MLNIITFDGNNSEERYKYLKQDFVHLEYKDRIEKDFMYYVNRMLCKENEDMWEEDNPRFDSEFDNNIMKEIDGASRCDLLVVKKDIGTVPITCLSKECKFGMLTNYYFQRGYKIVASWGSGGGEVFEFIGKALDIEIYMDKKDLIYCNIPWDLKNVMLDGNNISQDDDYRLRKILGTVTSAKLRQICGAKLEPRSSGIINVPLHLQCDYMEMNELIGSVEKSTLSDYASKWTVLKELRYDIRIMEINASIGDEHPVVWIFRKNGTNYKFTLDSIWRFPNFMDMLCEMEDIYQADKLLDEIFMVVFDTQEHVSVDYDFSQAIECSLVYIPHDKVMNIIGVEETIKKLNDIAMQTEIEVTEECPRKSNEGR